VAVSFPLNNNGLQRAGPRFSGDAQGPSGPPETKIAPADTPSPGRRPRDAGGSAAACWIAQAHDSRPPLADGGQFSRLGTQKMSVGRGHCIRAPKMGMQSSITLIGCRRLKGPCLTSGWLGHGQVAQSKVVFSAIRLVFVYTC